MSISDIFFRTHLEEGESVIFEAHRHWLFFVPDLFRYLVFGLGIPWLLTMMFPAATLIAGIVFLIGTVLFIFDFCDWFFDTWLITNISIIDIEWVSLFSRRSTRIDYETIEGVSYETRGFWGYIFQFGDIQIDKVSGTNSVLLRSAASPKRIELEILRHRNHYMDNKSKEDEDGLKDILTAMIRRQAKHIHDDNE